MPTKITYYAIVDDYSSREEPGGVLRRVEEDSAEYDEEFGRDLQWTRSWLLYSHERGNMDAEFYEIGEDEANQIVERIRRTVSGQALQGGEELLPCVGGHGKDCSITLPGVAYQDGAVSPRDLHALAAAVGAVAACPPETYICAFHRSSWSRVKSTD